MGRGRERLKKTIPASELVREETPTWPTAPSLVPQESSQPLDSATQATMGGRFGHNFADVRIYTGPEAAQSAATLGARAFSAGREIAFGAGEYAPDTGAGQRLIAHELAHVVQQGGASGAGAPGQVSDPGEP